MSDWNDTGAAAGFSSSRRRRRCPSREYDRASRLMLQIIDYMTSAVLLRACRAAGGEHRVAAADRSPLNAGHLSRLRSCSRGCGANRFSTVTFSGFGARTLMAVMSTIFLVYNGDSSLRPSATAAPSGLILYGYTTISLSCSSPSGDGVIGFFRHGNQHLRVDALGWRSVHRRADLRGPHRFDTHRLRQFPTLRGAEFLARRRARSVTLYLALINSSVPAQLMGSRD